MSFSRSILAIATIASASIPRAASAQEPFTRGDAAFMQGMIHHHAQALVMASMASTHGASERIVLLAKKITLSQRDEIGFMRYWLQYRKQEVPDTAPHSQVMSMPGMDMSSSNMPGMLTEAQMKALDAARGVKFDSLFLTGMIGHHKGALKMVADLVNNPPSGQESEIFRFTTDVVTDQSAEIDVMQQMLYNLPQEYRSMKLDRVRVLLCALMAVGAHRASAQVVTGSTTDPRAGLKAGVYDAGTTSKGMTLIATRPRADTILALAKRGGPRALSYINSDFVFRGNYLYQGNFGGFQIWDISNPASPVRVSTTLCTTDQGDPSIWGNLLFISVENGRGRMDCGSQGISDRVSKDRAQGIRIFDVSDPAHPRQVTVVQTCHGTHTHTLVPDPKDKNIVYIWGQGSATMRSQDELAGCAGAPFDPKKDGPDSSDQFRRIEVVKVPLDHPENWSLVSQPHIFEGIGPRPPAHGDAPGDTAAARQRAQRGAGGGGRGNTATVVLSANGATIMAPAPMAQAILDSLMKAKGNSVQSADDTAHAVTYLQGRPGVALLTAQQIAQLPPGAIGGAGRGGRGGRGGGGRGAGGPGQCHDITVYPALHLAAGACVQYGIFMDITDPVHPKVLQAVTDSNFALWHSATFSNDGTKLLFSDEWGGGTSPRCRAIDPINWGGDVVFDIKNRKLVQGAFYKMPAAQTDAENCVAHNGGLVPVPGRDIQVQGWYQGGISMVDFTDSKHPFEIAYFDRGPINPDTMYVGGSWGAYFYNGHVYSSEIYRGLDVFDLTPTESLTQNEIDAAKCVHFDQLNPQSQPKIVWPPCFPVVRAYLDQLVRDKGLTVKQTDALTKKIDAAEALSGAKQRAALTSLAATMTGEVAAAKDKKRVTAMAAATRDLARAAK